MRRLLGYILVLIFTALLGACGDTQSQSPVNSIKAVIKMSTQAASLNVGIFRLTITVPAGVSPPFLADGTTVDVANTVIITSPAPPDQILTKAVFTPATATSPGQLAISAGIAAGFTTLDSVTINLNITSGTTPVASDFNLLSFDAYDTSGNPVAGLSPTLTTTIQ